MSSTTPPLHRLHSPALLPSLTKLLFVFFNIVRSTVSAPFVASSTSTSSPLYFITHDDAHPSFGSHEFWTRFGFSTFLVLLGGVFSGLTIGLMGLDMVNLQVLSTSGTEKERTDSQLVMTLLNRGRHWVLVVLLLSNVVINESLPMVMEPILGGGIAAIIASTALIVIFGEIIPQAVCARYGLAIGAYCTNFVLVLMYLEYPIAYPIAKLLDYLLGESHGTVYRKGELKTFVGLHGHIGEDMLNEDEVTIISAVLDLSEKHVEEIMTPLEDVYTLASDCRLDQARVDEILAHGHSRIPIHIPNEPTTFIGMLIVKRLISYDPAQAMAVSSFPLNVLPETAPDSTCLDCLNYFQQGRSHILLISTTPGIDGGAIGVVTLEDVIEEMIGEEIIDESDVYVDVHNKIKVVRGGQKPSVASGKALAPLIKGVIERRRVHRKRTTIDGITGSNLDPTSSPAIGGGDSPLAGTAPLDSAGGAAGMTDSTTFGTGGLGMSTGGLPPAAIPSDGVITEEDAIGRAFTRMKVRGGGRPPTKRELIAMKQQEANANNSGSNGGTPQNGKSASTDGERTPLLGGDRNA